jgi:acetylornithine deacetylase/succinyl-diaminopimelate desuccinylase-like protein
MPEPTPTNMTAPEHQGPAALLARLISIDSANPGLGGFDGDPLAPATRDGRMFGRGAFDMKGGIAGIMVAGVRALARGLRGDLLLALVADEEHSSFGTEEVLGSFRADGAIVCEPTNLDVVPHAPARGGRKPRFVIGPPQYDRPMWSLSTSPIDEC